MTATNGAEALQVLQSCCCQEAEAACLILGLLDMNMPVRDGREFLKAFVKMSSPVAQRQGIGMVLLATTLPERYLARLRQLPVADVLHKPLTQQAISQLLQDYLGDGVASRAQASHLVQKARIGPPHVLEAYLKRGRIAG